METRFSLAMFFSGWWKILQHKHMLSSASIYYTTPVCKQKKENVCRLWVGAVFVSLFVFGVSQIERLW